MSKHFEETFKLAGAKACHRFLDSFVQKDRTLLCSKLGLLPVYCCSAVVVDGKNWFDRMGWFFRSFSPFEKLLSIFKALLNQKFSCYTESLFFVSEKYGSCSSGYPSTSSTGQRSIDLLSSPDNQPPHPFAIPTKVAPVHKPYGSSSGGSSSEDGKEASPKKSRWLQACKEKNSDHLESSGESQGGYSHDNFTPAEISSREVTHLDSPHMRSTPAELSFECLQLSGENRQMTTSVYSLPDPLHASPSDTRLFEVSDAASSSGEMIEGRHEPDVKKDSEAVLPKWVEKDIESKRIDFENMR